MSITPRDPNTIHLGGPITYINHLVASEQITPGMLVERVDSGGTLKWQKNASATNIGEVAVALEQDEMNLGVDDVYAAGDLVKVGILGVGAFFWGIIPSGQDINRAQKLQSNGDGKLKDATSDAASSNVAKFASLEDTGAVTADTRVRTEVIST